MSIWWPSNGLGVSHISVEQKTCGQSHPILRWSLGSLFCFLRWLASLRFEWELHMPRLEMQPFELSILETIPNNHDLNA